MNFFAFPTLKLSFFPLLPEKLKLLPKSICSTKKAFGFKMCVSEPWKIKDWLLLLIYLNPQHREVEYGPWRTETPKVHFSYLHFRREFCNPSKLVFQSIFRRGTITIGATEWLDLILHQQIRPMKDNR